MTHVKPLGSRVVAQLFDFRKKASSLILPVQDRSALQYMTVVSCGSIGVDPEASQVPMDLSPGDLILVIPHVGIKVPEVDGDLLILNYSDILAVIDQE